MPVCFELEDIHEEKNCKIQKQAFFFFGYLYKQEKH